MRLDLLFYTFLLYMMFLVLAAGCSHLTSSASGGNTRVALYGCDIVVDDTLGRMPRKHGGPLVPGEDGNGIECKVWGF